MDRLVVSPLECFVGCWCLHSLHTCLAMMSDLHPRLPKLTSGKMFPKKKISVVDGTLWYFTPDEVAYCESEGENGSSSLPR